MIAAGTILAWQNQGFYNNTENEYVNFQYSDASGMSQRSGNKDGTVFGNYDAEGAAVERDPLGGNVGVFTPYFTLNSGPPPEPESPMLQAYNPIDEMLVNGQRVPCMLDGIAIGCASARNMLDNGSAIPAHLAPFQNDLNFRFENRGLGIFTAHWTTSYNSPGFLDTVDDNGNVTGTEWSEIASSTTISHNQNFYFASWSPQTLSFETRYHRDIKGEGRPLTNRIKNILFGDKALSEECAKAFEAVKGVSIRDQLADGNLIFVTESIFMDSTQDKFWAPDANLPKQMREKALSTRETMIFWHYGRIQTRDITPDKGYKGKRYIGLTNRGMEGRGVSFSEVVIHSLMHSGGVEKEEQKGKHDFAYLGEKYNAIIKACSD